MTSQGAVRKGCLYIVATPIGNLGDMSERAKTILQGCELIAAEDTRHTGTLLKHFGITTPQIALHDHNESERSAALLLRLQDGATVALVSDAGTPAISDPGFELVRAAAAAGVRIVAIPGACAAIAALSVGGLPTGRFCFEGFLPAKAAARRLQLQNLLSESRTLVFYESPHRIAATLEDCAAVFGRERAAVVVRELTKLHETVYRKSLGALAAQAVVDADFTRGEIVLLVAGAPASAPAGDDGHGGELDRALAVLLAELPLKQAAHCAALLTGARENEAYKRALRLKERSDSP